MADIQTELVATLEAVAGAPDRVYPDRWPQDATFPLITYQLISRVPEYAFGRARGSRQDRWQIDVWARTTAEVVTLAGQIEAALIAWTGTTTDVLALALDNQRDVPEAATDLRRRSMDALVRYA